MSSNKVLGSGVIANAGKIAGKPFHIPAPVQRGSVQLQVTRLTVQPDGAPLRYAIDGDAAKGAKIRDGETRVFEGADVISRLSFCFPVKAKATAHVLFESDGTADLSFLLDAGRRSRGMTKEELDGFVSTMKEVAKTAYGTKPRGPDAVVNFQHFGSETRK
jgi:hypothetical protein